MSTSPLARVGLPADDEADAGPRSNRKAVLGIAALGAVGLAVVAQLLLGGGSELDDLGVAPAAAAAPPASASPTPTPTPSLRFPDADEAREGRDPFAPLYVEPGVTEATAAPVGAAPATGAVPPVGAAPGMLPGGTGPVGGPTDPAPPVDPAASTLALLRVEGAASARTAVFTVDGSEQTVAVGESFGPADDLLLLSLQEGPDAGGWTAVVQSGQDDPFDVVMGAAVPVPQP